jgi:phage terminase large subunit-like protein
MDAADSVDLNAAKMICRRRGDPKIYVAQMYWIPERKLEESKTRRNPDDAPYEIWESRGLLQICTGAKVQKSVFLDWFKEMRDKYDIYPEWIGYDPWHIDDSLLLQFQNEFGKQCMIPIRQGVATLSNPMKDLAAEFQEKNINYNNNPIDKWCIANTYTKRDINGNIQPDKGQTSTKRIDGLAALLDAYVVYEDHKDEFESMI